MEKAYRVNPDGTREASTCEEVLLEVLTGYKNRRTVAVDSRQQEDGTILYTVSIHVGTNKTDIFQVYQ